MKKKTLSNIQSQKYSHDPINQSWRNVPSKFDLPRVFDLRSKHRINNVYYYLREKKTCSFYVANSLSYFQIYPTKTLKNRSYFRVFSPESIPTIDASQTGLSQLFCPIFLLFCLYFLFFFTRINRKICYSL